MYNLDKKKKNTRLSRVDFILKLLRSQNILQKILQLLQQET